MRASAATLFAALVSGAGCSRHQDGAIPGGAFGAPPAGTMRATVQDTAWVATSATCGWYMGAAGRQFWVAGEVRYDSAAVVGRASSKLRLEFQTFPTIGTHGVDDAQCVLVVYRAGHTNVYAAYTGSVDVSRVDSTRGISGTFQFRAIDFFDTTVTAVQVTRGSFDVAVQEAPIVPRPARLTGPRPRGLP